MNKSDISKETLREYVYPNGDVYSINAPEYLYVKQDDKGDSHRVVSMDGMTHYPKRGWIAIRWRAPDEPVSF